MTIHNNKLLLKIAISFIVILVSIPIFHINIF